MTEKTGELIAILNVTDEDDLMIINQSGITLRMPLKNISVQGRATQGVKLIDLKKRGDSIASVCKVDSDPEEAVDEELDGEGSTEAREAAEGMELIDTAENEGLLNDEVVEGDEIDLGEEIQDEIDDFENEDE